MGEGVQGLIEESFPIVATYLKDGLERIGGADWTGEGARIEEADWIEEVHSNPR